MLGRLRPLSDVTKNQEPFKEVRVPGVGSLHGDPCGSEASLGCMLSQDSLGYRVRTCLKKKTNKPINKSRTTFHQGLLGPKQLCPGLLSSWQLCCGEKWPRTGSWGKTYTRGQRVEAPHALPVYCPGLSLPGSSSGCLLQSTHRGTHRW